MNRRAQLILPSAAMPWGRWLEGENDSIESAIDRIKNDPNSPSNQFVQQADKIANQIGTISVSTIVTVPIADFSGNVTGAFGSRVNIVSPTYTISAPTRTSSSAVCIFNFRITSSTGLAPSLPVAKVNGQQFSDLSAGPMRPPTDNTVGMYSLIGNVSLTPGQAVDLQIGATASTTGSTNTLSFDLCTAWIAFYGGL